MLGLIGVALDQEHPRLARGRDQGEVAVVVQQRVLVALEPRRDRSQPAGVDRLLEHELFSPFLSFTAWSATLMSPRKTSTRPFSSS